MFNHSTNHPVRLPGLQGQARHVIVDLLKKHNAVVVGADGEPDAMRHNQPDFFAVAGGRDSLGSKLKGDFFQFATDITAQDCCDALAG